MDVLLQDPPKISLTGILPDCICNSTDAMFQLRAYPNFIPLYATMFILQGKVHVN